MKQKSIDLLKLFLKSQLEKTGFKFEINPLNDAEQHWHFEVAIQDEIIDNTLSLYMKVDYYDESVWIELNDLDSKMDCEKVEEDRWTVKYFWYAMYCAK